MSLLRTLTYQIHEKQKQGGEKRKNKSFCTNPVNQVLYVSFLPDICEKTAHWNHKKQQLSSILIWDILLDQPEPKEKRKPQTSELKLDKHKALDLGAFFSFKLV